MWRRGKWRDCVPYSTPFLPRPRPRRRRGDRPTVCRQCWGWRSCLCSCREIFGSSAGRRVVLRARPQARIHDNDADADATIAAEPASDPMIAVSPSNRSPDLGLTSASGLASTELRASRSSESVVEASESVVEAVVEAVPTAPATTAAATTAAANADDPAVDPGLKK